MRAAKPLVISVFPAYFKENRNRLYLTPKHTRTLCPVLDAVNCILYIPQLEATSCY